MQPVKIEIIKPSELIRLTELCDYNNIDEMIKENTQDIQNGTADIFVMNCADDLIGELRVKYKSDNILYAKPGKRAYLYAFRVKEDYQGKGFGNLLLKTVIGQLKSDGYTEFTVGVEADNEIAKHLYHKFGFTSVISHESDSYQGDYFEYDLLLKHD